MDGGRAAACESARAPHGSHRPPGVAASAFYGRGYTEGACMPEG